MSLIHSSHTSHVFSRCAPQLLSQSPSPTISVSIVPILKHYLVCLFVVWQPKPENAVTIAVSSRVLFRTEREQKIFEQKGVEEYLAYQIEHENEPFAPGPAFPLVKVETHWLDKMCLFLPTVRPSVSLWFRLLCFHSGSGGRQRPIARAVPAE